MPNQIGARKNGEFNAVSTAPSINYTPVGSSTPPIPYPTFQDLSNSVNVAPTVNFNGDPVYVLDQTVQPSGKGDNPGVCGGIRSGTVNGEVKPTKGSRTVRACKKRVIRQGDSCTMNSGNNPGIYITSQNPSGDICNGVATSNTDPPIKPETKEEKGWFEKFWKESKVEIGAAVDHPIDGVIGAGKGLANMIPELSELAVNNMAIGEAKLGAWGANKLGYTETGNLFDQSAKDIQQGNGSLNLPKFEMNTAEKGGDKILTGLTLATGVGGLVKGGLKAAEKVGAKELADESKLAFSTENKVAQIASSTDKATQTVKTGESVAKPAGDGVKIVKSRLTKLDPNQVRFSQRTAGGKGRATELRRSMGQNGWNGPPVDAVETQNGITTIDNTRVAVARELGLNEIPVNIHSPTEQLPPEMFGRFGNSKTWGEALEYRTGRQKPPLPQTGTSDSPSMPDH